MTQEVFSATGALFGGLAVIFGAFGAHLLRKKLTSEQLISFETGIKYQIYHGIALLAIGTSPKVVPSFIYYCFTLGIILFSFSIYGLVLTDAFGKKLKLLGPVTPIGGLLLVLGWALLFIQFLG